LNGKLHGKSRTYYNNLLRNEEEYANNKLNGKSIHYNADGLIVFEGYYKNGYKDGMVKYYNYSTGKLEFEGTYKKGEKHGKAKEYDKEGKLIFDGEYIYGKKKNQKK